MYARAGKKGEFKLSNIKLFNQFLRENAGEKMMLELKVINRDGSDAQKYHLREIMLPRIQEAMKEFGEIMNDEQTENFMLLQAGYNGYENFDQMDMKELSDVIDRLKEFASRDLNIIIENP